MALKSLTIPNFGKPITEIGLKVNIGRKPRPREPRNRLPPNDGSLFVPRNAPMTDHENYA